MNQPLDLRLDKAEFLRWIESQTGRYELVGGRVVMMTGGSRNHEKVAAAFVALLIARLDASRWSVTGSELAIEIGEDVRYPDAMVEPQGLAGASLATPSPVLVVEVLSPSSIATDLEEKAAEYKTIASLRHYIVADQDEPRLRVWSRRPDGGFASEPVVIEGREATLTLTDPDVAIDLATLYRFIAR